MRATWGVAAAAPSPVNVLESTGPHSVEGGWRTRHRPVLRHAFLGALAGMVSGLFKKKS
ncbi:MAG: hypothetical protein ACTHN7_06965 [Solirubrobacterales bacterium]